MDKKQMGMQLIKRISILFLLLLSSKTAVSQYSIDSLILLYQDKKQKMSLRLQAVDDLAWNYLEINNDSAFVYGRYEQELAKHLPNKKDKIKWQVKALNTIGLAYYNKSDYPSCLQQHLRGLKMNEEIQDQVAIAMSGIYLGNVYSALPAYPKALTYYFKSLHIFENQKDNRGIAGTLGNIAHAYFEMKDFEKALNYQLKGMKIFKAIQDNSGLAFSYSSIGTIYDEMGQYEESILYQNKSLLLRRKMNDKKGIGISLGHIGQVQYKMGAFDQSLQNILEAIQLCQDVGNLNTEKTFQKTAYSIFKLRGNSKAALGHYERMVSLKDSIYQADNERLIISQEMKYEFDKKQAKINALQSKKDAIRKEKSKKMTVILFSVISGLLVVILLSLILFKRFRLTKNQNMVIENQIKVIENHQQEIIDSITYAKRIQDAILPPTDFIKEKIPQSFVLFLPKDIVAGDFYWMEEMEDTLFIAAADCTGHGVPGALVSVVCSNALNRALKEFLLKDPGAILDKVTELVVETFEKSTTEVKDGMDISLLTIDKKQRELKWSGANNPLCYVEMGEMIEIRANKQPIGKNDTSMPFTTHTLAYHPGTAIYLFTDGFADQFGGPQGKKLKYKHFKEILQTLSAQTAEKQFENLEKVFEDWKGELDQIDDVCVIGIKLD
jgi:serine phosphatase RsbU (regulator of sigma subunit)/alkylhydroperoxidase/carboxymuconolactone decarboxylase family protein YurZ